MYWKRFESRHCAGILSQKLAKKNMICPSHDIRRFGRNSDLQHCNISLRYTETRRWQCAKNGFQALRLVLSAGCRGSLLPAAAERSSVCVIRYTSNKNIGCHTITALDCGTLYDRRPQMYPLPRCKMTYSVWKCTSQEAHMDTNDVLTSERKPCL